VAIVTSGHCALQYRIRAPAVAEAAAQPRRPRSSLQARHSGRGTSGRCQEGRPPQLPGSVPHPPHSQPHQRQRKKQAGPARRECQHATGSGAGDITTTPASSPPPPVAAPAATLTERYRCLGYLADRGYSPQTKRAYAFGLQAFARWLAAGRLATGRGSRRCGAALPGVLPAGAAAGSRGRQRVLDPGRPQRRLRGCDDQPAAGRGVGPVRLRGDAGPGCAQPIPRRAGARRAAAGERGGLLARLAAPKRRSGLRVREPRRLPRGLGRAETTALLASFRTD
jgi:hypothetical protein